MQPNIAGKALPSDGSHTTGGGGVSKKSSCRQSDRSRKYCNLEGQLRRELNPARSAAAEERVSYAHVAGGRDRIEALAHFSIASQLKSIEGRIGDKGRQEGISEIRMVQRIEEVSAELQVYSLRNGSVFVDGEVPLPEVRSAE